ncbi:MAG TPA: DUF3050 domain-containing protein [Gammaproteobacteria bacterium]|nr:DUF3050 domain-containing protein [Gammaproteobacteria bacterium]
MSLSNILTITQPLVDKIQEHPTFSAITSLERLRRFAQIHVFAVYDFMALLQALQRSLTGNSLLWLPPIDHLGCHLIHTMLAEEESDFLPDGRCLSHFELYLDAMQCCGADAQSITTFINSVQHNADLSQLLTQDDIPNPAKRFLTDTFDIIDGDSHMIASAFAFGREHITSPMFTQILQQLTSLTIDERYSLQPFIYYFQRHIDLDGGKHSQQSKTLLANLCGTDENKWDEAAGAAFFSLKSRLQLLDGIYTYMTVWIYLMHLFLLKEEMCASDSCCCKACVLNIKL